MAVKDKTDDDRWDPEPRWLAWIVVLALGGIYTALPGHLIVGPRWAFLVVVVVLLTPTVFTYYFKEYGQLNRILGFAVVALVTAGEIASVGLLIGNISGVPQHREAPTELLLSAAALWVSNVLVFSLWYWKLDAGGPHRRERRDSHEQGA